MSTRSLTIARRAVPPLALLALSALAVWFFRGARLPRADLVINNGAEIATLDPATVAGVPEGRVMIALYEGLTVKDPRTLEPLPGVAERWDVSDDGLRYTFHVRADARWSNGDPCTAEDFVWSWRRLLEPETAAEYAYLLWCVRGARDYTLRTGERWRGAGPDDWRPGSALAEQAWSEVGIRAPDARTLEVELASPTPYFLDLVSLYPTLPVHRATLERAQELFPDTWQAEWVRPGTLVTNGPYAVVERRVNDRLRLAKNPFYWDEARVALRMIDVLAVEHYGTMLNMYLTGELDWIDRCAPSLIPRLLEREDFAPAPYLGTYFYRVNVTREPFDDVRVRRALALAIDRRAIVEKITKKGERALFSLCPPGMTGYEPAEMRHASSASDVDAAFAADCEEARALLASAGFGPGGRAFPTLRIHYNTSESHRDLAEVVADGWRRLLGIDAKLANQEWKVYLESQKGLDYDVSRSSWIGDYADPSTFLEVFVSGGENNRTGWSNARYDALVAAAAAELEGARRLELLSQAEALLMEELPVLPIYSYVSQNLVNPRLGGFHENVLDMHFPKFWYWKSDAELAAERAARRGCKPLAPAPIHPTGQ